MQAIPSNTGKVSRLLHFARTNGSRATARIIYKNIRYRISARLERTIDKRYGLDTAADERGIMPLDELEVDSVNRAAGNGYAATPYRMIRRMLSGLPEDLSSFTFVDFGSGKGRILFVAAEHNFQEVIGVEFSKALHDVAVTNVASYRNPRQRCLRITPLHMDATDFSIPETDCVLYFCNPFNAAIMDRIVGNIEASYRSNPRRIIIKYYNPTAGDVFGRLDFLRRIDGGADSICVDLDGARYDVLTYETVAS